MEDSNTKLPLDQIVDSSDDFVTNGNCFGSQSQKIELFNATNIELKAEITYGVENDQTVSR